MSEITVPSSPDATTSELLALVPEQLAELQAWQAEFAAVPPAGSGRVDFFRGVAARMGVADSTVINKFYAWRKKGLRGLIDKTRCSALWSGMNKGLSPRDRELVKAYFERNQRKIAPAIRALMRDWREGRVHSDMPLNPITGYPRGWGSDGRNLYRYAPSAFELKAARIGRAAASSHRPLVYTTRRNLYPGQFYLFDDMWHDHEVVDLDQRRRGRPLEFHALDLASACKFAWGTRTRVLREDGTHEGLQGGDFRFLLASVLFRNGYSREGTTLVVEHGTAAISESIEQLLSDATGGAIKVARSGMTGAAAHSGQYAGRAKGNFRFKAALESLGNLIHNELAALPGQTGMNRLRAPEEQHGRQRHTDALICALSQLPAERIEMLQWPLLTIQQFRLVAEDIYARINARTDHDLEGWDERYVPDPRTGKMRRLSPTEAWQRRRGLSPIDLATMALIIGPEHGVERMTRNGMIELRDGELSGDLMRFDASDRPDREKFLTVLNPYDPSHLLLFDARGAFIGAAPRLHSVCRADTEAVQREMGRAAKTEAALLAPLRARHMAEAREKLARHENNAKILGDAKRDANREDLGRFARGTEGGRRKATDADLDEIAGEAVVDVEAGEAGAADDGRDSVFDL